MHSLKEHIGMAGPWGYKLSTIAIAWGRVTLILTLVFAYTHSLSAQDIPMTMQAVLAHNDYQKPDPFHHAYEHRVGVMEADLYYDEGRIIVAHDPSELEFKKDLERLYLEPLRKKVRKYGRVYPEDGLELALMLDIKNESALVMEWIVSIVEKYPDLFGRDSEGPVIHLIISGDRPPKSIWASLPASVKIDGRLTDQIPEDLRSRIYMVSSSFRDVVPGSIDADGGLSSEQVDALRKTVEVVHRQNLKIRFWGVPDNIGFWKLQNNLGVDVIGCDHLDELAVHID